MFTRWALFQLPCPILNFKKDPDGEYWCSTRTRKTGRRKHQHVKGGNWGYCQPGCDVAPLQVIYLISNIKNVSMIYHIMCISNFLYIDFFFKLLYSQLLHRGQWQNLQKSGKIRLKLSVLGIIATKSFGTKI